MHDRQISSPTPCAFIVNDDPVQLVLLSALAQRAGVEPRMFTNAETALAELAERANSTDDRDHALPSLIITDLYMPGIDGWRFCRLLRSPEYTALNNIPIMVVSAIFTGVEPETIAANIGAETFLTAPVDGRIFTDQVKTIIGKGTIRPASRTLIIEDSQSLASMLQKTFIKQGYPADIAHTFQDAAEACSRTAYDVAIIDYYLPDKNGDGLLDLFRSVRPSCACIMMTTDPRPELTVAWMKRGAAACIHKPFQPDHLIELALHVRHERTLLHSQDMLEVNNRELRESEARFRKLFQDIPSIAVQGFALDGTVRYWNKASELLYGYTESEAVGHSLLDLIIPPEMRADVRKALQQMGQTGEPIPASELELMRKDGSRVFVFSSHAIVSTPEKERELFCLDIDLTERKCLQNEVMKHIEKLDLALDVARMGYWVFDCASSHVEWSSGHRLLFGMQDEAFGGTLDAVQELIHPDDRARGWGMLAATLSERTPFDITYRGIRPNGDVRTFHTYGRLYLDRDDRPDYIFGVTLDITELKQKEEEKAQLESNLQQAQKMEAIGHLAGGVAHDFNNMLGVIIGRTELAIMQADPASKLFSNLQEIRKAAERSADLTRQLLTFARQKKNSPKILDINEAVEKMLKIIKRLIGENITLDWQPTFGVWPVWLDPSQLDQILANLCVNARDAITGIGTISITTRNVILQENFCKIHFELSSGDYVMLSVKDDGCGMDKATIDRIFEPFFTTKTDGRGTGLGLATVYGIIRQSGGCIDVHSKPGEGTAINLYLPRREGNPDAENEAHAAAGASANNHETILVVEDEPANLDLTTIILKGLGYHPLPTGNFVEALGVAGSHNGTIHLVLTDIIMPGMNGRDLADKLTALKPGVKRLYMSGYTADVIARSGILDLGIHFIQKPFSIGELASKIRLALDDNGGEQKMV